MRQVIGGLVAVGLLVLTACSGTEPSPSDVRDERPARVAWTAKGDWLTEPVVAAGRVVALRATSDRAASEGVDVVALDASSGKQVWRHPWHPSVSDDGDLGLDLMRPTSDRPLVAAPVVAGDRVRVVVIDLRSGRVLHRTRPMDLDQAPGGCPDGEHACLSHPDGSREVLDLDSFALTGRGDGRPLDAFWADAADEFFVRRGERPTFGRVVDGIIEWERPLGDVVPALGDGFARVWFRRSGDLVVGQAEDGVDGAAARALLAGRRIDLPLPTSRTFAFAADDGDLRWDVDGAGPCVGLDLRRDDPGVEPDHSPLRCVRSGRAVQERGVESLPEITDAQVTAQRYDDRTGRALWSARLTADQSLRTLTGRGARAADGRFAPLETTDGAGLLDLRTGRLRAAARDLVVACGAGIVMSEVLPPYETSDGTAHRLRPLERGVVPCRVDGTTDGVRWTRGAIRDVGRDADDGVWVVRGPGAIRGFALD